MTQPAPRVLLVGLGVTGIRAGEQLMGECPGVHFLAVDPDPQRREQAAKSLGTVTWIDPLWAPSVPVGTDLLLVAAPQVSEVWAAAALRAGVNMVSLADDPAEIRTLMSLSGEAAERGVTMVAGAGMSPGVDALLVHRASRGMDTATEVRIASYGTAGPACARRHHAALTAQVEEIDDSVWQVRAGGTGRELVWFPEPVGGADCYRVAHGSPLLLSPSYPEARRIVGKFAATRRDRLSSPLPMLRRPHAAGLLGAVRVEVRGTAEGRAVTEVLGMAGAPGQIAGTLAAQIAFRLLSGVDSAPGSGGVLRLKQSTGPLLAGVVRAGFALTRFG